MCRLDCVESTVMDAGDIERKEQEGTPHVLLIIALILVTAVVMLLGNIRDALALAGWM